MIRIVALAALLALAGCGVKGPLEPPPKDEPGKKKPALSLVIGG